MVCMESEIVYTAFQAAKAYRINYAYC
jgi:hypothetical protein